MHIQQSGHQLTSETNEELWTAIHLLMTCYFFRAWTEIHDAQSRGRPQHVERKPSMGRAPAPATENAVHIHVSVQSSEITQSKNLVETTSCALSLVT